MVYSPVQEIMSYFYFEFSLYVVLTVILLMMALKGIWSYIGRRKSMVKGRFVTVNDAVDTLVGLLAMMGMGNAMMFQGVLSDIPHDATKIWTEESSILFVMASLFFFIQLVCIILKMTMPKTKNNDFVA